MTPKLAAKVFSKSDKIGEECVGQKCEKARKTFNFFKFLIN